MARSGRVMGVVGPPHTSLQPFLRALMPTYELLEPTPVHAPLDSPRNAHPQVSILLCDSYAFLVREQGGPGIGKHRQMNVAQILSLGAIAFSFGGDEAFN